LTQAAAVGNYRREIGGPAASRVPRAATMAAMVPGWVLKRWDAQVLAETHTRAPIKTPAPALDISPRWATTASSSTTSQVRHPAKTVFKTAVLKSRESGLAIYV